MRGRETQPELRTVTPLAPRRRRQTRRASEPVRQSERGGGRMWINGHELGGASERFRHLGVALG